MPVAAGFAERGQRVSEFPGFGKHAFYRISAWQQRTVSLHSKHAYLCLRFLDGVAVCVDPAGSGCTRGRGP